MSLEGFGYWEVRAVLVLLFAAVVILVGLLLFALEERGVPKETEKQVWVQFWDDEVRNLEGFRFESGEVIVCDVDTWYAVNGDGAGFDQKHIKRWWPCPKDGRKMFPERFSAGADDLPGNLTAMQLVAQQEAKS